MNIVIAGGGKIGYYLVNTLQPYKHRITVIEPQKELCEKIANQLNVCVINGDATTLEHLEEAQCDIADIFIAVTGKDEENLIACQLAKRNFKVDRTIARVNNPKNITVFEKLGVDMVVSSTSIIADLIEQEVDYSGMKTLMKLKNGNIVLSEILITGTSRVKNKCLKDLKIPRDSILISVIRQEDTVIIPNGFTELKEGDHIIVASSQDDQQVIKDFFIG